MDLIIVIFALATLAVVLTIIVSSSKMVIDGIDISIMGLFRFRINGKRQQKNNYKKEKVATRTSPLPKKHA